MADDPRFAVYLSHSWRPRDVDLNVQVWGTLAGQCEILVDEPEGAGANPPYYINRIEELLRRSDLFVSILTYRAPKAKTDPSPYCSPYMLFEIRLAERAETPRLILYERNTGFRPPRTLRPWEAYVPFDRGPDGCLIEQRQWATVIQAKLQQWVNWAAEHRRPISYEPSMSAAILLDDGQSAVHDVVCDCLQQFGFDATSLDPKRLKSSEAFRSLHEAGLMVADVGSQDLARQQLYAAAHVIGLPGIRMLGADGKLPWILTGEPAGYQEDIVSWNDPQELPAMLNPRIAAMVRSSPARRDVTEYLQSKRYSQFLVFISHTLKPPHRALVENVYTRLKKHNVTPFEYHEVNTAGMDWKKSMGEALQKTTHFVALLSPDYELSPTCVFELEEILARGDKVSVMPFMVAGRDKPNPKLTGMHNMLLSGENPDADAQVIVDQVMAKLNAALQAVAGA